MRSSSSYYYSPAYQPASRREAIYAYSPYMLVGQIATEPPNVEQPNGERRLAERIAERAIQVVEEKEANLSDKIATGFSEAFKKITLSLVLVAVVTGGAFATGNWLAHRYLLPKK